MVPPGASLVGVLSSLTGLSIRTIRQRLSRLRIKAKRSSYSQNQERVAIMQQIVEPMSIETRGAGSSSCLEDANHKSNLIIRESLHRSSASHMFL